jgi:hypothetical protein
MQIMILIQPINFHLGIIFVIILHRATNIMPTHVKISIEPGIRELFRFYQGTDGNFMHSSVPRQRLFLGAVPITSRYYLQEYITLQKLFQLPPAIIYKNI